MTSRASGPTTHAARGTARALVAEHGVFIGLTAAFVLGSIALGPLVGWPGALGLGGYATRCLSIFPALSTLVLVLLLFRERLRLERGAGRALPPRAGWSLAWTVVRPTMPLRIAAVGMVTIATPLILGVNAGWRVAVADLGGFRLDLPLAALDRALHGGVDPWRLVHTVLGVPWRSQAMAVYYAVAWGLGCLTLAAFAAVATPSWWARRVLVAYVLMFAILGCAVAVAASSAGPIFLPLTSGADSFDGLLAYLESAFPSGALSPIALRDLLWRQHASGVHDVGAGITAFPSMHLAGISLFALALSARNIWLGVLGWGMVALMLAGSVHLGWHYAVDGYASILGMALIWWLAGRLTRQRGIHRRGAGDGFERRGGDVGPGRLSRLRAAMQATASPIAGVLPTDRNMEPSPPASVRPPRCRRVTLTPSADDAGSPPVPASRRRLRR